MGKNTRKTKEESKKATEIVQQLSAVSKTSNKRRARAVTNKKHKDAREEEKEDMEEKQHLSLAVNDDTTAILPTLVATEPSLTSSGLFQPSDGAADSSFCTKGQEWTPEEDEEVIAKLRIIRSGELSTKNMTVRLSCVFAL
ncbi:hypothetical protein GUITHDRAFT_110649 [Guillardia theta CCMP2712]|uniref:Uncharacterized protein n=2 Tax=Guillardia theta TaxID=55529 RepID=L1J4I2_GUITC|nr:hypothetical protein GUITHDRAFT_110649 [Guillardia theta CCMP2712]EKX43232.1 hypothetical protein GUITHDRAFT_110649 [Guillardia theta CCMP2712]|mmetsp:Transcript_51227/g.160023  ORF Transcript_51227/g.160023 Transcript_51227/m.160023 type:complete len:141 (+) Transcript_51227:201-623(+)|eukprot:XP_005830212.1 hypothetical protein GUITHDRAFT_110649 [Guillardia theta CCMP2712]